MVGKHNKKLFGGLSLLELLRRTCYESWQDAVFGQAGRMAFYHFLGLFPTLFIFLTLASHSSNIAEQMRRAVSDVGEKVLPQQVSLLFQTSISELNSHVTGGWRLLSVAASALWASLNATWALIYGLNMAYEVTEERKWWKLACTVVGLSIFLALVFWLGLLLFFAAHAIEDHYLHAGVIWLRMAQWGITLPLLMIALAVLYRFAPNLRDRKWGWSAPGALCALAVWIVSSVGVRLYAEEASTKKQIYGHMTGVVMLLLWLYLTNAAILIGGEMNSEIEKAADQAQNESRSGG